VRVIEIKVRPAARDSRLQQAENGRCTATLKSPPVDGRANAELIALVARQFGVPKAAVAIRTGAGSRVKRVSIDID
jgi:uncharacterized protein